MNFDSQTAMPTRTDRSLVGRTSCTVFPVETPYRVCCWGMLLSNFGVGSSLILVTFLRFLWLVYFKAYELLNVQPIPQLLSEKWINYGFFFFMMWMFLYVGYMVIFTLVVFNRPLEFSNRTWCSCPDGRPTEFNSTCPCNGDIFGVLSDGNLTVLSLPCSTTSLKKRPVFVCNHLFLYSSWQ